MNPDIYLQTEFDQERYLDALDELGGMGAGELRDGVFSGVCQTLSLRWIKLKLDERAGGTSTGSVERVGAVRREFISIALVHADGGAASPDPMKHAASVYGLTKGSRLFATAEGCTNCDPSSIAIKVKSTKNACYLYRFAPEALRDRGYHAIGMYQSGGKLGFSCNVYVFDPNFGEYKVPNSSFQEWLSDFRRVHYKTARSQFGDELITYS